MSTAADAANLRQRIVSAVVLAAAVLALTWAGGVWFRLLAVAIAGAVLYEWLAMTGPSRVHRLVLAVLMAVVLVLLALGLPVPVLLLALAVAAVLGAGHAAFEGGGSFWPAAGLAYAGLSGIALASLRAADAAGLVAILFLFAVVWATDILAYFTGRRFGGPKLAPSISPGKTWSGAAGGTVAGVAAGMVVAALADASAGMAAMLALALLLSIVSQAGDLFESSLKRRFSVKDSSKLIPGHGGVMDRVDGLVAAAFALFVAGALAAGADMPAHAFFAR